MRRRCRRHPRRPGTRFKSSGQLSVGQVFIGIPGIAEPVAVGVGARVARVADGVPVAVRLVVVGHADAVVADEERGEARIADQVAVAVERDVEAVDVVAGCEAERTGGNDDDRPRSEQVGGAGPDQRQRWRARGERKDGAAAGRNEEVERQRIDDVPGQQAEHSRRRDDREDGRPRQDVGGTGAEGGEARRSGRQREEQGHRPRPA